MFQAMWQQNGNQRQGGECVFVSQSGDFAGGGTEKTPAGDYSINACFGTRGDVITPSGARSTIYPKIPQNRSCDPIP
jgi:hypothetical protein